MLEEKFPLENPKIALIIQFDKKKKIKNLTR